MTEETIGGHISVLLQESIDGLDLHPGDIFLDCTLGSGGHSEEVARRFGETVQIIGIDADADALKRTRNLFKHYKTKAIFVQANFRNLDTVLDSLKIERVNKILFDLGLSSNQLNPLPGESGRGFSFQKDEPLEMTFIKDPSNEDITAATILNEWSEETIRTILQGFGEERYAERIARAIIETRLKKPITRTGELVEIVLKATPKAYHHRKIHPATKTFQALRIAANDELGALRDGLQKGFERLSAGGRIAAISFHSLEDRIVKNFFREKFQGGEATLGVKKPLTPSPEELTYNRRARSAKLRILIKN